MRHPVTQILFILLLSGAFGANAVRWVGSHASAISQAEDLTQVLEIEDEASDESSDSDELNGAGSGANDDVAPTLANHLAGYFHWTGATFLGRSASIKQSQVNLFDSLQTPALFILFHSYEGYLS